MEKTRVEEPVTVSHPPGYSCRECLHCRVNSKMQGQFVCAWRPPQGVIIPQQTPAGMQMMTVASWPPVALDEWCGQFEPAQVQ